VLFGQPALSLAAQLQRRAERAGVPPALADLPAGPAAEGYPAGPAADGQEPDGVSQIGAALFSLVAQARAAGLDPELELRAAARCYRDRVRHWAEEQDGELA